jgi:hypothetical protein
MGKGGGVNRNRCVDIISSNRRSRYVDIINGSRRNRYTPVVRGRFAVMCWWEVVTEGCSDA